jgi:hypothetical protein
MYSNSLQNLKLLPFFFNPNKPQNGVREGSPGKGSPIRGNASLGKAELLTAGGFFYLMQKNG